MITKSHDSVIKLECNEKEVEDVLKMRIPPLLKITSFQNLIKMTNTELSVIQKRLKTNTTLFNKPNNQMVIVIDNTNQVKTQETIIKIRKIRKKKNNMFSVYIKTIQKTKWIKNDS